MKGEAYDVVVAGAGLAGGSMALRLARRGLNVALLDASAFPRSKLCGEYLSPEGVAALDGLGLGRLIARGEAIRKLRLTTTSGRTVEAELGQPGEPSGLGLTRLAMDDAIVGEAVAAGATWMPSTRVGGPIVEGERVVGVHARSAEHGPITMRAGVVIAADGRHSALVRRTGIVRVRSWFRPGHFGLKRHVAVGDALVDEPAGCVGLHLVPGGYVGACRVDGGVTNVCGLLPEALLRAHRGDLDALAGACFPANPSLGALWRSAQPLDEWKTVAGVRVVHARPTLCGIFYLGDCRGTVDPLGGQGMTMALLGAELAESFVVDAIRDADRVLSIHREYERMWHRRFDRRVNGCRVFHHALVNAWPIEALAALGGLGAAAVQRAQSWGRK